MVSTLYSALCLFFYLLHVHPVLKLVCTVLAWCHGCVVFAFFKCSQKSKKYKKVYGKKGHPDAYTSQPSGGAGGSGGQGGPYIKRITNDVREDQMEQNLQ